MYTTKQKTNSETVLCAELKDLLLETVPPQVLVTNCLSETQESVLKLVRDKKNVLVLGSAGCGKSTVIKEIKREFKHKTVAVCSTTGISAYNIEGITLHSFMGFGTGQGELHTLYSRIRKRNGFARLQETTILIVDEISMLSAELFEKVDALLKRIRNSVLPFGGMQVIFSGDLLQLKPVIKITDYDPCPDERLIFESEHSSGILKILLSC